MGAAAPDTSAPSGPFLLTPARPDTSHAPESAPQPLLIPGRSYAADTLTRTRSQRAREHLARAKKLESDGNPTAAVVEYQNAVNLDPTLPGAYQHMGQIYEAYGWLAKSVQCYAAEVQHHPENHVAARQLGVALVRVGEIERGIKQLELLARAFPRDGANWRALGYAYTQAKRFDDAEHAFRMAIDLPPLEADELRDLGVLLANRGRGKEARELYLRAARVDPKDGLVWVNLGNLDAREGHYQQALASYRTGAERDSIAVMAYRGQVQSLQALGREDEIADVYRRWLHCAPDDEDARLDAVQYFARKGRRDVALEIGREGVRLHPQSGDAHMILGVAYGAAGDARSSLVELRRAQLLYPEPDAKGRAEGMIAELRGSAPDSLRAFFAADSIAAFEAAKRDSTRKPGARLPKPGIP
ncbi:MAG TPA: tetratricopeptide repeat protein [Candidatus Sulfotelmatobacter sp.]|nr:tetratricopeptide repeat protein [Candidatus Sulfotelmatobacter sp.]